MILSHYDLVVIGGGAAGIFAAIIAASHNPKLRICVLEGSSKFLSKVEISGGGRCNVTHSCYEPKKLVSNYPRGNKELLGPFFRFQPKDIENWLSERGVELKTESDGRVFPVTDSSKSITDCFLNEAKKLKIELLTKTAVTGITQKEETFEILTKSGELKTRFLLLATGSSHSGHKFASSFGHTITPLAPSLFTFKIKSPLLSGLAGTSFPNVTLELKLSDKSFSFSGPALITHWGLSGPAILKLSSFAARELCNAGYQAELIVNWDNSIEDPQNAIRDYKKEHPRRIVVASSNFGFTQRFWKSLCSVCIIPEELTYADLNNEQIKCLADAISKSKLLVTGKGEFKEEFVTCGGVSLEDIDFRTFESKLVPNLFFAGEILDIDGITGGFNFQNAWTGGWHVGVEVARR